MKTGAQYKSWESSPARGGAGATNGQALIETIIFIPLFVSVFSAIAWFWRVESVKAALLPAAKYGTDLIVHKNLSEEQVRKELISHLCTGKTARLERSRIKIIVKNGGVLPPPAFSPELTTVEIQYELRLPEWMGSKYVVKEKSAVLNDSFSTNFGIPDNKNHS